MQENIKHTGVKTSNIDFNDPVKTESSFKELRIKAIDKLNNSTVVAALQKAIGTETADLATMADKSPPTKEQIVEYLIKANVKELSRVLDALSKDASINSDRYNKINLKEFLAVALPLVFNPKSYQLRGEDISKDQITSPVKAQLQIKGYLGKEFESGYDNGSIVINVMNEHTLNTAIDIQKLCQEIRMSLGLGLGLASALDKRKDLGPKFVEETSEMIEKRIRKNPKTDLPYVLLHGGKDPANTALIERITQAGLKEITAALPKITVMIITAKPTADEQAFNKIISDLYGAR